MSIVTPDGGLTTLGYALCVLAAVLLFLAASFITRDSSGKKMSTKQLVYLSLIHISFQTIGNCISLPDFTRYINNFLRPWLNHPQ